jgi:alkylhydroperoxidase family enzyme
MGPLSGRIVLGMERRVGVQLDYLRAMVRVRPGVLRRMMLYLAAAAPRSGVPRRAVHLAGVGATMALDCGECVQIAVNVARDDGVPPEVLAAVVGGRRHELDPDDQDVVAFGEAATLYGADTEQLRLRMVERFGEEGAQELALAVAFAQFFPVLKRGLGMARSCATVTIDVDPA